MADSLDDFFAKKDKKRAKDKSKTVLSAEALVRELEEGSKQLDYPVRKENKTSTAIELLGLDTDDADWRDFEDVEKRDYTGLKVKEMSLQDQNEEEQRRILAEQSDQAPESTPWKIKDEQSSSSVTKTEPVTSNAEQTTDTHLATNPPEKIDSKQIEAGSSDNKGQDAEEVKSSEENASSSEKKSDIESEKVKEKEEPKEKKYLIPQLRNMPASGGGETKVLEPIKLSKTRTLGARSGPALNLQNKQEFPSLG